MNRPIGFFDSGIGGATVLKAAMRLLPREDYVFFSDSANNPYGDKSDEEIILRSKQITRFLVEEKRCRAVVIACNTASAKAARAVRASFQGVPVAAIEPAYKVVHDERPQGATLIMATKGTIKSEKFRRLYYSYYDHNTSVHACPGLADLIERGDEAGIDKYLEENLSQYRGRVRNVVLGCTHYPLIKAQIAAALGDVRFYDGSAGVARRLKYLLEAQGGSSGGSSRVEFEDSSADEKTRAQKEKRFFEILEQI